MSIDNSIHYYALENPPSGFAGDYTIQIDAYDSGLVGDGSVLDVPLVNGKIDRSAVESFIGGTGKARVKILYDLVGSQNATRNSNAGTVECTIYENGVWNEDSVGNVKMVNPNSAGNYFVLPTAPTATYSIGYRLLVDPSDSDGSVYGSASDANKYGFRFSQGGTSSFYQGNVGSPTYYKNGASFTMNNTGSMYDYVTVNAPNILLAAGGTHPTYATDEFSITGSNRDNGFIGDFYACVLWSTDESANQSTIYNEIDALYSPSISGTITYNAAPVEGASVDLISVDQVGGTETVAETGLTTQADGTVTSSASRDGSKEYYFRVYPFNLPISGLTGTLTATDATNLDLGVDLSALDTGQNRAYTIKATGGTGSGEVILIKGYTDKANGLVTVDYHPFGNDTTFEVCRLISGENASVLPRTS